MNEVTGAVLRLDLGLQRLLPPSWSLESASRMEGEVSSSMFVTLGKSSAEMELPLCSTPACIRLLLPNKDRSTVPFFKNQHNKNCNEFVAEVRLCCVGQSVSRA